MNVIRLALLITARMVMKRNQVGKHIDKLREYESAALQQEQVHIPTNERIIGPMYIREILIPAGTAITGRVYKSSYVDIMISGDITIIDNNGTYRLTGYNLLEGPAGRKRAGYAHSDTIWLTVHDAYEIKHNAIDDISFSTLEQYEEFTQERDRNDYMAMCHDIGVPPEQIEAESTSQHVVTIDGPFEVAPSMINGQGIFATRKILSGEHIGTTKNPDKTLLGRYTNHSVYPNAIFKGDDLIAIRQIEMGHEITVNYRLSPRAKQ